ncbi:MAG TPA: hypothetical protein VHC69_28310 [Polyangiaceae bacterium]|nr:hypothetical protein [Polyangiaceae bacterium]
MKVGLVVPALVAVAILSRTAAAAESSAHLHASAPAPRARPSAPDPDAAAATEAFRRGAELVRAGDWEGALAAFEESARAKPHPITTYNVAFCERALGRYVRASLHFEEVLAAAAAFPVPREVVNDAHRCLEEMRPRIVHVSLQRRPLDMTITVDGLPLERAMESGEPVFVVGADTTSPELPRGDVELLLDPGTHVFVGAGADEARVVESRTYAPGQLSVLALTLPERAPPPSPPPPVRDPRVVPAPKPNRTAAYVAFGVSGVGLAGALTFGGLALSEKHSLDTNPACSGKLCPATYADTESRMRTFADLATVSIATFAAGAAVGTYLLLTAASPKAASARIAPWFAGTSGGIAGRF